MAGMLPGNYRGYIMKIIAWTGGSRPNPLSDISRNERAIVRAIFRDSMSEVFSYWGDYRGLNDSELDMARIQWKRARYNAHATFRG